MGRFALKASRGRFAQTVITTYTAYLNNPALAAQTHPVTNRPPSDPLFILPFTRGLPPNYFVRASCSRPVIATYLPRVNTGAGARALDSLNTGTQFSLRLDRFAAARINIRTGRTATGTQERSKTSGLPYKYYGGTSVSIPFGKANNTETIDQAFSAIRADIIGPTPSASSPLVTLVPERRGTV